MKTFQSVYKESTWETTLPESSDAQLVFCFGAKELYSKLLPELTKTFPDADIIGCSTSGEILDDYIHDDSLSLSAITWEKTTFTIKTKSIDDFAESHQAGVALASNVDSENLKHLFILSDGQKVNGAKLLTGLKEALPNSVSMTGGLAGDGERFEQTCVWHNDKIESGLILICGFYGDALRIRNGCAGGWDVFGPDRLVTKSKDNILYELDGTSALELYKEYLGDHATQLPGSALLFPLHIHSGDEQQGVVRTILNGNEKDQSMVFAGDIPEGAYAQLMHANFDRLVDGAGTAAQNTIQDMTDDNDGLAILISCVGRRIVLKQRTEEELEAVKEMLSDKIQQCGFYSYGEISPIVSGAPCNLQNQTMAITIFSEQLNA